MIQCSGSGIQFEVDKLHEFGLDHNLDAVPSQKPTQAMVDANKNLSPIHDQLKLHLFWWIFEILPLSQLQPKDDGTYRMVARCVTELLLQVLIIFLMYMVRINLGRRRVLSTYNGVKVHRSARDLGASSGYQLRPDLGDIAWVN